METLDKVYLEYSQITKARTIRERKLAQCVERLLELGWDMRHNLPDKDGMRARWERYAPEAKLLLEVLEV